MLIRSRFILFTPSSLSPWLCVHLLEIFLAVRPRILRCLQRLVPTIGGSVSIGRNAVKGVTPVRGCIVGLTKPFFSTRASLLASLLINLKVTILVYSTFNPCPVENKNKNYSPTLVSLVIIVVRARGVASLTIKTQLGFFGDLGGNCFSFSLTAI